MVSWEPEAENMKIRSSNKLSEAFFAMNRYIKNNIRSQASPFYLPAQYTSGICYSIRLTLLPAYNPVSRYCSITHMAIDAMEYFKPMPSPRSSKSPLEYNIKRFSPNSQRLCHAVPRIRNWGKRQSDGTINSFIEMESPNVLSLELPRDREGQVEDMKQLEQKGGAAA